MVPILPKISENSQSTFGETEEGTIKVHVPPAPSASGRRVQKLLEQRTESQFPLFDQDDITASVDCGELMPPTLNSFLSGLVSLSDRSIHAISATSNLVATLPSVGTTNPTGNVRGKSLSMLLQVRRGSMPAEGDQRVVLHSPPTVLSFDCSDFDFQPDSDSAPPVREVNVARSAIREESLLQADLVEGISTFWQLPHS